MNRKFTIECEINERWIPYFLGMLKLMEYNGSIGRSKIVKFYADGDGDFHPKFNWDTSLPKPVENNNDSVFDAG